MFKHALKLSDVVLLAAIIFKVPGSIKVVDRPDREWCRDMGWMEVQMKSVGMRDI